MGKLFQDLNDSKKKLFKQNILEEIKKKQSNPFHKFL
jgi:hypothetical protein